MIFSKKYSITFLSTCVAYLACAAPPSVTASQTVKNDSVIISATFENCSAADSFSIFRLEGLSLMPLGFAYAKDGSGKWQFKVPKSTKPKFYYACLNQNFQQSKAFLIGTEKEVKLTGACYNLALAVASSPLNDAYEKAQQANNTLKMENMQAVRAYQMAGNNEENRKNAEKQLAQIDKKKLFFLDSLKAKQPFLAKIIALEIYTSYQNAPNRTQFKDEVEYFAKKYFQYANLEDADYENIQQLADAFHNYTQVIVMRELKLSTEEQKNYIDFWLSRISSVKGQKIALGGVVALLVEKRVNPNIVEFGERYIARFGKDDPQIAANIADQVGQFKASMLGVSAPEIVQADTSGKMIPLSSLRGKIVMIDFWASWCGPCRRENPFVVSMYEKYKAKGFDIYSVSLDDDRTRWINAIKTDKLMWTNHVSDLKGWTNQAAQLYGVTSIPKTVLLDRDGKIIARDLRGEALAAKLKEIFGE